MGTGGGTVLTIGHSTHSVEAFVALLDRHCVSAVADVRSVPYSRFNPDFNREPLARSLAAHRTVYVFLGRELGGRPDDPSCYDGGRISYERVGATRWFRLGLDRVVRGAARRRIALMCAERDPLACHRTPLVAPALEARGISVGHILADGGLETHAGAMGRLLVMHGLPDDAERQSLFPRPRDERIREAVAEQAKHVGSRRWAQSENAGSPSRHAEERTE